MNDRAANVQVTARREVPDSSAEYAFDKIRHVVSRAPDRIDQVHVVLGLAGNPAHEAPADVEVEARVAGRPVHVHATAAELTEAIDEAADRLSRQLTDLRQRPLSRRRRAVAEGPCRSRADGSALAGPAGRD